LKGTGIVTLNYIRLDGIFLGSYIKELVCSIFFADLPLFLPEFLFITFD